VGSLRVVTLAKRVTVDEAELVVAGELRGEIKVHVLCRPVLLWTMGARSELEWDTAVTFRDRRIVRTWCEQFQLADSVRLTGSASRVHMGAQITPL